MVAPMRYDVFRELVAVRWNEFKGVMEEHYRSEEQLNTVKNAFLAGIAAALDGHISRRETKVLIELIQTPEHKI